MITDWEAHLLRQMAFSHATFGPGCRTAGVIAHIRKELGEVERAKDSGEAVMEWVDVVILALDGLTRQFAFAGPDQTRRHDATMAATAAVAAIKSKQTINEGRTWPDWRTAPQDGPIEHDRGEGPDWPEGFDALQHAADCAVHAVPDWTLAQAADLCDCGMVVRFGYTNWRGEHAPRRVMPLRVRWAADDWHPEPQWQLLAWDVDRQAQRNFVFGSIDGMSAAMAAAGERARAQFKSDLVGITDEELAREQASVQEIVKREQAWLAALTSERRLRAARAAGKAPG